MALTFEFEVMNFAPMKSCMVRVRINDSARPHQPTSITVDVNIPAAPGYEPKETGTSPAGQLILGPTPLLEARAREKVREWSTLVANSI